jgi:hypothetical protein
MDRIALIREIRYTYRILAVKAESNRPLGSSRQRWNNSIKIYLKMDSSGTGGPLVGCCEHGIEPLSSFEDGEFLD